MELRATLASKVPGRPLSAADEADEAWIEGVIAAPHGRFSVDSSGRIEVDARVIGQLTRGPSLLVPNVRLVGLDAFGAGARSRVLRRLVAYARDLVEEILSPLRSPIVRELSPAGRGVVYQLEQGLGTVLTREAEGQVAELSSRDLELFRALDVEVGERVIYVQSLLRRPSMERRAGLCRAYFEGRDRPLLPPQGAVSFAAVRGVDPKAYAAIGYPVIGARAIRADMIERAHKALAAGAEAPPPGRIASLLGCSAREVPRIAEALSPASPSPPVA
jgi:ATP-dependent RNA helicase SUPV3L1/SUV3